MLMKIATAFGKMLGNKMTVMANETDQLGAIRTIDNNTESNLGQLSGQLQGRGPAGRHAHQGANQQDEVDRRGPNNAGVQGFFPLRDSEAAVPVGAAAPA
ncbi:MAG: hypothetical protein RQ833_08750 [Sphingomonadaceae bacterium]|nr:hypothetical protein [Sphingomonadaceae bacterium]